MIKYADDLTENELWYYLETYKVKLRFPPESSLAVRMQALREYCYKMNGSKISGYESCSEKTIGVVLNSRTGDRLYTSSVNDTLWQNAVLRALFWTLEPDGFDFPEI